MKKLLSIVLALMLTLSLCSAAALAAEAETADPAAAVTSDAADAVVAADPAADEVIAAADGAEAESAEEEAVEEVTESDAVIAVLGTSVIELKDYGFSMLVPNFPTLCSAASSSEDIYNTFGVTYQGFVSEYGYIVYGYSEDGTQAINVAAESDSYSLKVGNLKKLDDYALNEFAYDVKASYGLSSAGHSYTEINGVKFLHITSGGEEESVGYNIELLVAVVDGVKYTVIFQLSGITNSTDLTTVDQCINSITIRKGANSFMGLNAYDHTTEYILIALVVVLIIVVAFLTFFIVRFNMFSKAAGSSFNIIGFDLPVSEDDLDSDDTDDDDEDEYDDDEDEDDDQ